MAPARFNSGSRTMRCVPLRFSRSIRSRSSSCSLPNERSARPLCCSICCTILLCLGGRLGVGEKGRGGCSLEDEDDSSLLSSSKCLNISSKFCLLMAVCPFLQNKVYYECMLINNIHENSCANAAHVDQADRSRWPVILLTIRNLSRVFFFFTDRPQQSV